MLALPCSSSSFCSSFCQSYSSWMLYPQASQVHLRRESPKFWSHFTVDSWLALSWLEARQWLCGPSGVQWWARGLNATQNPLLQDQWTWHDAQFFPLPPFWSFKASRLSFLYIRGSRCSEDQASRHWWNQSSPAWSVRGSMPLYHGVQCSSHGLGQSRPRGSHHQMLWHAPWASGRIGHDLIRLSFSFLACSESGESLWRRQYFSSTECSTRSPSSIQVRWSTRCPAAWTLQQSRATVDERLWQRCAC